MVLAGTWCALVNLNHTQKPVPACKGRKVIQVAAEVRAQRVTRNRRGKDMLVGHELVSSQTRSKLQ